jgi:glycerol-3-phosphate O-acyltransferase
VLEGNSFTYEMMGEAKIKESLSRLLKAVNVLKENYGRIYIELCDTISVKQWLNTQPGKFS